MCHIGFDLYVPPTAQTLCLPPVGAGAAHLLQRILCTSIDEIID
jgi:hypothetical protein